MSDSLEDRGRALEEEFFRRQNEKLLAKLRAEHQKKVGRAQLTAATGISNAQVLDALVAQKIDATSLAAFALVPLVEVAWADGSLDPKEKAAITKSADDAGVKPGTHAHELLDNWLAARPGPELARAWMNYTNALCAKLDAGARAQLKLEVIGRARRVAEASGGILGLTKKVSDAEAQVLAKLDGAFPK